MCGTLGYFATISPLCNSARVYGLYVSLSPFAFLPDVNIEIKNDWQVLDG
jgi:hypothetical protein